MFNVLLSSAGKQCFLVEAFRDALNGRGEVLASDTNLNATALKAADSALLAPAFNDSNYVDWLLEICVLRGVRLLLSLNVDDLLVLEPHRIRFEDVGCMLVGGSLDSIETTYDKFETFQFCQRLGLPVLNTWLIEELATNNNIKFPLIAKPRFGKGSRGIMLIRSQENMERMVKSGGELSLGKDYIFQQFVEGIEFGFDVVNNLDGNFAGLLARKKILMKNGETNVAVTEPEKRWMHFGRLLSKGLKHQGTVDVDVIVSGGVPFLIDVNFRFGGGYVFSHLAGANIPKAYISWGLKESSNSEWLESEPGVVGKRDAHGVVKKMEEHV